MGLTRNNSERFVRYQLCGDVQSLQYQGNTLLSADLFEYAIDKTLKDRAESVYVC